MPADHEQAVVGFFQGIGGHTALHPAPVDEEAQVAAAGAGERDRAGEAGDAGQQNVLVFGSREDVVRETRECLEVLGAGGGYIVAPSHALETDIPTENVLALYETALLNQ